MGEFCAWSSASYEQLLGKDLGQTCTLFAGGFGANAEECSSLVDDCVDKLEAEGFSDEDDACRADLAGCPATVAEIEACFADQLAALERMLDAVSCEGGLPAELEAQYAELSPACAKIDAKCPHFFDDGAQEEQTFACNSDENDEEVPMSSVCDGRADCSNGADEAGCEAALRHFVCDDGTVIQQGAVCDNNFDCPTGEDEICP
jgi:hypothetical protein